MQLRTRGLVTIAILSAAAGLGAERLTGVTAAVTDHTTTRSRTTTEHHRTTTSTARTTTRTTTTAHTTTSAGQTTTPADGGTKTTTATTRTTTSTGHKTPTGTTGTLTGTIDFTYSKGQCSGGQACFDCHQPVNLTLVRIRVDSSAIQKDAIGLNPGCTGSIGRIDVVTKSADGVKIANNLNGDVSCSKGSDCAHDLTIGGGTVLSAGRNGSAHQDCMQALGGNNITFTGVVFGCQTANNAQWFLTVNTAGTMTPTPPRYVVCDRCEFHPGAMYHDVTIGPSWSSGVRNSLVCPGGSQSLQFAITTGAVTPIDVNNQKPWPSDPRCW
jgi:type II secretory pathway pseudopilin PulG